MRKPRPASPADVIAVTGYPAGGVAPLGLPAAVPVIVDAATAALTVAYGGGGQEHLLLRVQISDVIRCNNALVADITERPEHDRALARCTVSPRYCGTSGQTCPHRSRLTIGEIFVVSTTLVIIGLPSSGKTTVFNALTRSEAADRDLLGQSRRTEPRHGQSPGRPARSAHRDVPAAEAGTGRCSVSRCGRHRQRHRRERDERRAARSSESGRRPRARRPRLRRPERAARRRHGRSGAGHRDAPARAPLQRSGRRRETARAHREPEAEGRRARARRDGARTSADGAVAAGAGSRDADPRDPARDRPRGREDPARLRVPDRQAAPDPAESRRRPAGRVRNPRSLPRVERGSSDQESESPRCPGRSRWRSGASSRTMRPSS